MQQLHSVLSFLQEHFPDAADAVLRELKEQQEELGESAAREHHHHQEQDEEQLHHHHQEDHPHLDGHEDVHIEHVSVSAAADEGSRCVCACWKTVETSRDLSRSALQMLAFLRL